MTMPDPPRHTAPPDAGPPSSEQSGTTAARSATPPFILGIVGDSGSGKDTVGDAVVSLLASDRVTDLRLDDYRRFTREERTERGLTALSPEVHDLPRVEQHLRLLRAGYTVRTRRYSHSDGTFGAERIITPREMVLVRGPLGFATPELRELYDLAIFLQPEPDLLFRWKLRRDVLYRGYSEAEVLKHIASHLLDSKEYVLPQALHADLLVSYRIPDWEAPDSTVITTLRLRRSAARVARSARLFEGLAFEESGDDEELLVTIPADIEEETSDAWGRAHFPTTYEPAVIGSYHDETGASRRRASLAILEVLIARLGTEMAVRR